MSKSRIFFLGVVLGLLVCFSSYSNQNSVTIFLKESDENDTHNLGNDPILGVFDKNNLPIQEDHVVEFNTSGPVGDNTSIIYQYGHTEVGAFYSVSANTIKNWTNLHTTGFNFSLPEEYFPYWNLSYVNYFDKSSITGTSLDDHYLNASGTMEIILDAPLTGSLDTTFDSGITDYVCSIFNSSDIKLHFSSLTLQANDNLTVYNSSLSLGNPEAMIDGGGSGISNPNGAGDLNATGWTDWLGTPSTYIVLNSSGNGGTRSYSIDRILCRGVNFNHTGTDQLTVEVNPDVVGFNLTLYELNLPNNARFVMSDPWGTNVTEFWRYDGNPEYMNNWTYVNANRTWGPWGSSDWIEPDYLVLKMYSLPGDENLCNFTIADILYNTTVGWRRYYVPEDNFGDSFGNFIDYIPFTQNITVNFTRYMNLQEWDPAILQCYSSWTFIFEKRPYDINITIWELHPVDGPRKLSEPIILESGMAYNVSFNITDSIEHLPVDWYNWIGDPPLPVGLQISQDNQLVHINNTSMVNGIANFTLTTDWGVAEGIRSGDFQILAQINQTNYAALDNTSARAVWRFIYKEHPVLSYNKMRCEYFNQETSSWESSSPAVTVTTGTLFDPNTVEINVSASNIHGETEPLNGQPINVTVMFNNEVKHTSTIFQNYHPLDFSNYALFNYSFNEIGRWNVTFTLENSSTGVPLGYYFATTPVTLYITAIPRQYLLDVYNGTDGLQPGQRSEVFANITDKEEVDVDGVHYPLGNWKVDFYFLRFIGKQWRQYYLSTSYTNNTGIAKINWIPPEDLIGQQILLYIDTYTPENLLNVYVENSSLLKRDFDMDRHHTWVQINTSQSFYYFDEVIALNLTLFDELNNTLLEETVNLTIHVPGFPDFTYDFLIGVNNTKPFTLDDFLPYLGDITISGEYLGSNQYYPSSFSFNVTYKKAPCIVDTVVDPEGYNYGGIETIPVAVSLLDFRNNSRFYDSGDIEARIYDFQGNELVFWNPVLNPLEPSNVTYDWHVEENGLYFINVTYNGGIYHLASKLNISVVVDRAPVIVNITPVSYIAGQDLMFEAKVTYDNGTPMAFMSCVFQFTDYFRNTYLLGYNTTESDGYVRFWYPYDENDYYYLYLIEFGGEISVTSKMDLQFDSGFDMLEDFQIQKCPTAIQIFSEPSVGNAFLVSLVMNTSEYASPVGEVVEVEIWSSEGTDYRKLSVTIQANRTSFTHTAVFSGNYFIRVVYKGSHIFQPTANILRFNPSTEAESAQTPRSGNGSIQSRAPKGNPNIQGLLQLIILVIPLLVIGGSSFTFASGTNKKFLAVVLVGVFGVCGLFDISQIVSTTPSSLQEDILNFNLGCKSGFLWLDDEDLPEEDLIQYQDLLGDNLESNDAINEVFREFGLTDLTAADSEETPRIAQSTGGNIHDTNLGAFGMVPYPIGDTLNVTFTTKEESNYFIVITDINRRSRVLSYYGSCGEEDLQSVLIPITESKFNVGGKYSLELFVYNRWSLSYKSRDTRRMTFSVVRGFVSIDVNLNDVELYQNRFYSIQILEEFSNTPLRSQDLTILRYDDEAGDYIFDRLATTDEDGWVVLPLPVNSRKGAVPIKVVFKGDEAHYGSEGSSTYSVKPITTFISLSAPPTFYTDEGTITALIYDQYGNPLEDKPLNFYVHLQNTTYGEYTIREVDDEWLPLGNGTTNAQGYATLTYRASFPEGLYEASAIFEGDDFYNESKAIGDILEIYKERLNVEFVDTILVHGHNGIISANLTDDDGPGGTAGNASTFTPVSFSVYYQHEWIQLGSTNTTGDGLATIYYTPYFDAGTYPLRLNKEEDSRYATNVEYGELTILHTNSRLDVGLNTSEYLDELMLSATLTYENGSNLDPIEGESLLFYLEQNMVDGPNQFTYIGYAITDENGIARLVWNASGRTPGIYLVKVMFPGNQFADFVEVVEYGVQITKGSLNLKISAPVQTPVLDYCDINFNLTNRFDEAILGEKLQVTIFNKTNPGEIAISREIITDGEGMAYFRWVPGNPGNYTAVAQVVSEYYSGQATMQITVIRKSIVFNTTISGVEYHRGDTFTVSGNTTIVYKNYDGSTQIIGAPGVPLRFYIWNESYFTHPVSGFQVPNIPLQNLQGEVIVYSDNEGHFDWSFIIPDEFYGLQAGEYFLKIRVDPTQGGLFGGECYIGFDLVEETSMEVWVDSSENVKIAQEKGHVWSRENLDANTHYFVEERETIYIRLWDQDGADGTQVHVDGHQGLGQHINGNATYRDLLINIGEERVLYFHLDIDNLPSLYLYNDTGYEKGSMEDLASMIDWTSIDFQANPQYDMLTGTYSFTYVPYYPGDCNVGVNFAGDRFYDSANDTYFREVYRRPTYFDTVVSHTEDLYRNVTDPDDELGLQKWSRISVVITDVINGTATWGREVYCYWENVLMNDANGFTFDNFALEQGDELNKTDALGTIQFKWTVEDWLQRGDYNMKIKAPTSRVYASREMDYTMEIWETSHMYIFSYYRWWSHYWNDKVYYSVYFVDQDGYFIRDAQYSFLAVGHTYSQQYRYGDGRIDRSGSASLGYTSFSWYPNRVWGTGNFEAIFDYLGDMDKNIRPCSRVLTGWVWVNWWNFGFADIVNYYAPEGSTERDANPYLSYSPTDEDNNYLYYNLQEARRKYALDDYPNVNTFDGYGYVRAEDAYYVWQKNSPSLQYFPMAYESKIPAIIAFGSKENAQVYVEENSYLDARVVPFDFVWSLPEDSGSAPKSGGGPQCASDSGSYSHFPIVLTEEDRKAMSIDDYIGTSDVILPSESGDAGDPSSASYLEDQGVGVQRTHETESGSMYGRIANMALDYSVRGSYVFAFRLLEYILAGGRVYVPGDPQPYFQQQDEDLSFYDQGFEDVGLDLWSSNPVNLYWNINSTQHHLGSRSLYLAANGTVGVGDQIVIPYENYRYLGQANEINVWLRYQGTSDNQHSSGITMRFVDSDGRYREADLKGDDLATENTWHKITIPMSDLLFSDELGGHMKFGKLSKIVLNVENGGFLSQSGSELWIDDITFTRTKMIVDVQDLTGSWVRVNYDDFLNQQIITYLIARPLFLAVRYAIFQEPNLFPLRDVFTWDAFEDTIDNVIGAGSGWKDAYDVLRDLLGIIRRIFYDIEWGSSYFPRYLISSRSSGIEAEYYSLDPYLRNLMRGSVDRTRLEMVWRFIVCTTVQGISFNIPSYWFEISDTWDRIMNKGERNINGIVKYGFGRISSQTDMTFFVTTIILGYIEERSRWLGDLGRKCSSEIVDNGFEIIYDYMDTHVKSGNTGSIHPYLIVDTGNIVGLALSTRVIPLLGGMISEVVEKELEHLTSGWIGWWGWLVRLILRIILYSTFYPMDWTASWLKFMCSITYSAVLSNYVGTTVAKIFNRGIDSLLYPFRICIFGWWGTLYF